MDSDELRNMYANLLAKAMVVDTKDKVHPAFVEIIKQMSNLDVKIFDLFCKSTVRPIISIYSTNNGGGEILLTANITWLNLDSIEVMCTTIDNLKRCGLIGVSELENYMYKEHYDHIRNALHFINQKNDLISRTNDTIIEREGAIQITDMGKTFYDICVYNEP